MGFRLPLAGVFQLARLRVLVEVGETAANLVNLPLAVEVQLDVVRLAAGLDGRNEREREALVPGLVLSDKSGDFVAALHGAGLGAAAGEHGREAGFGGAKGIEKAGVVGDLVAAQAGLFVDDQLFDVEGLLDAVVGTADISDLRIGQPNLPVKHACAGEECKQREEQNLAKDAIETRCVQRTANPPGDDRNGYCGSDASAGNRLPSFLSNAGAPSPLVMERSTSSATSGGRLV